MLNYSIPKPKPVMGIDCSTHSFAFAIIDDGVLIKWGEVDFSGSSIYERILNARKIVDSIAKELPVSSVAIESAIVVKSVQVAIKMAYVFGAVMSSILTENMSVIEVSPISWQSFIGNKVLTRAEKLQIQNEFPGKSKSWYTSQYRKVRKARTIQWVKDTFGIDVKSDNVADAIGISYYSYYK
jgi:Holliday junction resolvasome RuvABC endonuclease subunit